MSPAKSAPGVRSGGSPFNPRLVLGLLLVGALAFIAALYFIGVGESGPNENNGQGHALGRGLNGYAALTELLGKRGYDITRSRSESHLDDEALLILSPPLVADAEEINGIIERRRYVGPTLVILPKWLAFRAPETEEVEVREGWVTLLAAQSPDWANEIGEKDLFEVTIEDTSGDELGWEGLGESGNFPAPGKVQSMTEGSLTPLVVDAAGHTLAGYWNDDGLYPVLADWAGIEPRSGDDVDDSKWPVVVVSEPDLMNNYGLADRDRAMAALGIVEVTLEDYDLPIVFDVTLNGLGSSENLLTLAFTPPFLAATLCLILAALVVGWRAFGRFGPPLAEEPVFAFGKRQLATNGAALIQRARRLHLLGAPYAALIRKRIARMLGLRNSDDVAQVEHEIDRLLAIRNPDAPSFSAAAEAVRQAGGPHELLRRAHALKQIERTFRR